MVHFVPLKNLIILLKRVLNVVDDIVAGTCGQRPWRQVQESVMTWRQILHFGGCLIFPTA